MRIPSPLFGRPTSGGVAMAVPAELRRLAASVTVEPVLFLFMVGSYMQYTAMQSLVYAKVSPEFEWEFYMEPSDQMQIDLVGFCGAV